MKSSWKIAALVSCVILICGAAITWHLVKARADQRKLAEDANVYRARAEQGDAEAQLKVARMYYYGKGVPQDYAEAARWCRKAADQDYAKAQYCLGYSYSQGKGEPQDNVEAFRWYRKAADQGYARAQYALGFMYYGGMGVSQDDAQAVGWYRKAADQGDAMAEEALGSMYYQGKAVPQDYGEALGWYRKAADHDDSQAQYDLGYMYSRGIGVQQNYAEAARWYRKAAEHGDANAQRALASMRIGFTTQSKINLSIVFLGSVWLIVSSPGNIRNRLQRRTALLGLLGLSWLGLDVYGHTHFGLLQSISAVNIFYFGKSLLAGTSVALLVPIVWSKGTKTVLGISGILFLVFNIYASAHYDLRRFITCLRVFYSINGLLIGTSIASVIFLWLEHKKSQKSYG